MSRDLASDVGIKVAAELVLRGPHVVTARDLGLESAPDSQQLLAAAERRAILVTHNRSDVILLNDAWNRWSRAWDVSSPHAGILVCPASLWSSAQLARELSDFLVGDYELTNRLYLWSNRGGWSSR